MVGAAGQYPGGRAGGEVGLHFPEHAGHGQLGQVLGREHGFHLVHYHAEAVAQVHNGGVQGRAGGAVEHQTGRVGLAADAQRVHFHFDLAFGNRGADFEHVRTQNLLVAGLEVVGVVFHEGVAAGQAGAHHLHGAHQRRGFPVTFAAEAVALGHQPLRGNAGQLGHAVQVLEGIGEALGAGVLQKLAHASFDAGRFAQAVALGAAIFQAVAQLVFLLVSAQQLVHLRVADLVDDGHQITDAVGVHRVAKFDFGFHFVAFGHGHVAHVVAEADEFGALPVGPGRGHAAPDAKAIVHGLALPMAHHHLAVQAHAGADEAKLPVAVRRLVGVHKIHVDVGPRNVAVELRVQVRQRLLQDF